MKIDLTLTEIWSIINLIDECALFTYLPDPPCLNRQSRSGTRSGRLTCACSKSLVNGTNLPDGSAAAFPLASACG